MINSIILFGLQRQILFTKNGIVLISVIDEDKSKEYFPIIHFVDQSASESKIVILFEGNTIPVSFNNYQ